MFRGITSINIDPKGRIAVPTRYRDGLLAKVTQQHPHPVVMTIDTESPCLLLYPTMEWNVIESKLQNLPSFNPVTRRIQRLLIGHATELEIDNTGRLLIPPVLREYAKLDKKLVLIGQGKKFEIWDETIWGNMREEWLAKSTSQEELPTDLKDLSL